MNNQYEVYAFIAGVKNQLLKEKEYNLDLQHKLFVSNENILKLENELFKAEQALAVNPPKF